MITDITKAGKLKPAAYEPLQPGFRKRGMISRNDDKKTRFENAILLKKMTLNMKTRYLVQGFLNCGSRPPGGSRDY